MLIKQSSAVRALVFFMYDSADHVTGKTGLSPTVVISKNGGSPASPSGAVTEVGNGFYKVAGNATDTNTLGMLALSATASGADQATMGYEVVVYDPDTAIAPASTALSTSTWTGARAGYLDNLSGGAPALAASWTGTRASYLDNLSGGAVALAAGVTLASSQSLYAPAKAGDAMTLTGGERTAVANEVEAQIIDETDSEKVLTAITDKIASVNPSLGGLTLAAIASAVWANATRVLTAGTNIVLPSNGLSSVTAWTVGITGNITGNVSGSVGSVTGPVTTGAISADAISAAAVSAAAVTKIQAGLSTYAGGDTSGTTTLLSRVTGVVALASTALSTVVWTSAKAAHLDADISSVIGGGGGSGLSGPSSVTLTFEDENGDPVPLVDFTVQGQGPGRAGVDGVCAFGLENGEYTIMAAPRGGVLFENVVLAVSGTTAATITGTAAAFTPPADPSQTSAYLYTRDAHGALEGGVEIEVQLLGAPGGDSYPTESFIATSDDDGLLRVLLKGGARYRARRGSRGTWETFTAPAGSVYQLPQMLGRSGFRQTADSTSTTADNTTHTADEG